jgi:hypothetical protein
VGFAQKVDDLFDRELLKRLAATTQGIVELDRSVLHPLVGILGTPDQQEMLRPGDSVFSIAIETHAEKTYDFTLAFFRFGRHRPSSFGK